MSRKLHNILITGGTRFIGSNYIYYLFNNWISKNYKGTRKIDDLGHWL